MVYVKEVTMPLSVYVMVDLQEMIVQSLYVQERKWMPPLPVKVIRGHNSIMKRW
jgi:hypothetical protein